MGIRQLQINGVRNLHPVTLNLSPQINVFYGENGSGKTSVLEAIHLLALTRSFRSNRIQPVIQQQQEQCLVFAELHDVSLDTVHRLGMSRNRQAELQLRLDGQSIKSAAELAAVLPVQVINPDSFSLLEGAPKVRRQFLDWGVFHVEHSFMPAWQRLQHSLRQRNSLLRHATIDPISQQSWDRELSLASAQIDQLRQAYIHQLKPVFEEVLGKLITLEGLSLSYYRGWDRERELSEVLLSNYERDRQLGYTQAGPQRADLRIRIGTTNSVDVLSRGQQKLVVCALRIAQGYLLSRLRQHNCIYLVDDLPSELDQQHRKALCQLLENLNCQVFITSIDKDLMIHDWSEATSVKMFHVEHGQITPSE